MQDKRNIENVVQEIMGLVADYAKCYHSRRTCKGASFDDVEKKSDTIQSKLRELAENSFSVREPLTLEEIYKIESASYVSSRVPEYVTDSYGDEKTVWHEGSTFSFPLFARNIERAHGITNTSEAE